jgi:hypothetical protein
MMQAQETAAPQEYTRPRRGLLASLTATFSDMSSDDEASFSQRRSGSTAGVAQTRTVQDPKLDSERAHNVGAHHVVIIEGVASG